MPTIIYVVPLILASAMMLVAELRDRRSRGKQDGVEKRGFTKEWVAPVVSASSGAVIGSSVAVAKSENPHAVLIFFNVSWSLYLIAGLMRLVKKELGIPVCAGIFIVIAAVSFFFAKGLM